MSVDKAFKNAVSFFDVEAQRRAARRASSDAKQAAQDVLDNAKQQRESIAVQSNVDRGRGASTVGAAGAEQQTANLANQLNIEESIREEMRILSAARTEAQRIRRAGRRQEKKLKRNRSFNLALGITGLATGFAIGGVGGALLGGGIASLGGKTDAGNTGFSEPPQPGIFG